MRRIDEPHLDYPFAGSRMLRDLLRREGVSIGRRHAATLMKRMGRAAIYRRSNTQKLAPGHLRAYASVADARASIGRHLDFFNTGRPHSSLDRRTPDEAYFGDQAIAAAARKSQGPACDVTRQQSAQILQGAVQTT